MRFNVWTFGKIKQIQHIHHFVSLRLWTFFVPGLDLFAISPAQHDIFVDNPPIT